MTEAETFRHAVGHFAAGVAVVTTLRPGGGPAGLTASAVSSVSLRPPLVLACVDVASESHAHVLASGVFAINVLGAATGPALARRFAMAGAAEHKFSGVVFHAGESGAPVLDDALAWLDCRVLHAYPGGDHTIFVGEVLACGAAPGEPLVYYRGGFGHLER